MAPSNRWLRSGWFALVTAQRAAISARELADPAELCRTTKEFTAGAVARARRLVDPDRHRSVRQHGVCTPFGVDLRACAIHRESLGCRQ